MLTPCPTFVVIEYKTSIQMTQHQSLVKVILTLGYWWQLLSSPLTGTRGLVQERFSQQNEFVPLFLKKCKRKVMSWENKGMSGRDKGRGGGDRIAF